MSTEKTLGSGRALSQVSRVPRAGGGKDSTQGKELGLPGGTDWWNLAWELSEDRGRGRICVGAGVEKVGRTPLGKGLLDLGENKRFKQMRGRGGF